MHSTYLGEIHKIKSLLKTLRGFCLVGFFGLFLYMIFFLKSQFSSMNFVGDNSVTGSCRINPCVLLKLEGNKLDTPAIMSQLNASSI